MVTSESVPFSKSGGLADVVGALSSNLASNGCKTIVMLPSYGKSPDEAGDFLTRLRLRILGGFKEVEIRARKLGEVVYWFVCSDEFCKRRGIYGDTSFTPYPDNFLRFLLLSKAALAVCEATGWIPDIFHCHDWTAGLVPYLLKQDSTGLFKKSRTLFTIHNIAYQGEFPKTDFLYAMEAPERDLIFNDKINMLRCGLIYSDAISTVSPQYALEIQTPQQGFGMEDILTRRSSDLFGILNGIDTDEWNPQSDPAIPVPYSIEDMSGKAAAKAAAQEKFNLPKEQDAPLFAMISRLAWQKGIEETLACLEDIVGSVRAQFLIIGTGDRKYEEGFRSLARRFPNLSANMVFSDEAAHLAEAASDFFLMPSHYEPCGLNQMYSLRYASIPVASRTGGLSDTIKDIDEDPEDGNGIFIKEVTPSAIAEGLRRAVDIYGTEQFTKARKNAMKSDFSWGRSAATYKNIYDMISMKAKGGMNAKE